MDLKGGDTPGQSVGDPLWAYYGYVCDGIFQNEEEIKNHPTQSMGTPVPGDLKYRDLNGDKVVEGISDFSYRSTLYISCTLQQCT